MGVGISVGIGCGMGVGIGSDEYVPTVAATLSTGDLTGSVLTDGAAWTATLTWQQLGVVGNGKVLALRFDTGANTVEVRDNQTAPLGSWEAAPGAVGVLITGDVGNYPTIGDLETAINASSDLVQVTTADPTPAKIIDGATLETEYFTGTFSGGV